MFENKLWFTVTCYGCPYEDWMNEFRYLSTIHSYWQLISFLSRMDAPSVNVFFCSIFFFANSSDQRRKQTNKQTKTVSVDNRFQLRAWWMILHGDWKGKEKRLNWSRTCFFFLSFETNEHIVVDIVWLIVDFCHIRTCCHAVRMPSGCQVGQFELWAPSAMWTSVYSTPIRWSLVSSNDWSSIDAFC